MLFTSSFKLLSVAAFMLPALLVGASPHSLPERRGNGEVRHVTFNECVPSYSSHCPDAFPITLKPREGEPNIFEVEGGWKRQPAIAEATLSLQDARDWSRNDPDALAYGHDSGELREDSKLTYYVIFKIDEQLEDSDGSGDTVKG